MDTAAGPLSTDHFPMPELSEFDCHCHRSQRARAKADRRARAVDAKASKGRKVRYDVHAKLVNFMAPGRKMMHEMLCPKFFVIYEIHPVWFIRDTSNFRLVCHLEFPYMVHTTLLI